MKKIGIFSHDFYPIKGGQGTHIFNIYKQFLNINFRDFLVFSPSKNELNYHVTIFPETNNSKLKNIGMSLKLLFKLADIILEYNIGLIHLHGGPGGVFLFRKPNLPVIYTCHHTYWQQFNYIKGQQWKIVFYYLERLSYKLADKIICVSRDTQMILETKYSIPKSKLVYIPNGIDLEEFKYNSDIEKEENSLVFLGRLDERKGILFLVETMELIINEHKSIVLYIIGEGFLRHKLEVFIKNKRLENNIIICGRLENNNLKARIQKSEIMITPSVFEGFGISVLEGMALNVPIIGTDVDGIRTIIESGENGILIKFGDKSDLKNQVIRLIKNKDLQKRISKNAFRKLKGVYDWNLISKNTLLEYEKFFP